MTQTIERPVVESRSRIVPRRRQDNPRPDVPNHGKNILNHLAVIVTAFGLGLGAGLWTYPEFFSGATSETVAEHEHDHASDLHAAEEVIELTPQAVANLGLEMGHVELGDFWKMQTFPGEVVEVPGQSDLSVAAQVTGVIEQVNVRVGQAVTTGEQLFILRITDQQLTTAQSELLDLIAQSEIKQTEVDRLAPLAKEGAVSGTRKRELEYELRSLLARQQAKVQEILARGLSVDALNDLQKNRTLTTRLSISIPPHTGRTGTPGDYCSIGAIHCHPGMAVKAGEDLCDLAMHGELYVRGQAFEADLDSITKLADSPWTVTAEFGHHHHGGHDHAVVRRGRIQRIDNHVDPATQTFAFFMPLKNDVVRETREGERIYRQWRFRPGQRAHLKVPVSKQTAKIKLPAEAVAIEGPNAFVFREHSHEYDVGLAAGAGIEFDDHVNEELATHPEDEHDEHEHDHEGHLDLEPVPVHIVARDHQYVVINPQGELQVGDEVAMNCGHKLLLALKMAAGGGGGHHHDHEH